MKKNMLYFMMMLALVSCYQVPILGMFEGLTNLIAKRVMASAPKVQPAVYQTPADMVPLSDYHCIGKIYNSESPLPNLEQEIKQGLRYFELNVSSGEKTSRTLRNWFRQTTEQIPVVGSNKRPLIDVITQLAAILQKSAYRQEVVIVKLNIATSDNLGSFSMTPSLQKLFFTHNDVSDLTPTLAMLRTENKRLILLLSGSNYETFPNGFLLQKPRTKELFNPDKNYLILDSGVSAHAIKAVNNNNNAAVGSPTFPKVSRSFFSPHFNMYHYVGMDYTGKNTDEIQRELTYGVRGFILPLKNSEKGILVGNTNTPLKIALEQIALFAQKYNEIVTVHLKNIAAVGEQAVNTIIADPIIQKVLFKPADRLTQAQSSAAKDRILAYEKNSTTKKIWPRLLWHYKNKKLVQITWDAPENTKDIWAYNAYYNDDITAQSLSSVETDIVAPTDFATAPSTTNTKPVLFYSGALKAEQGIASAITISTAFTVGIMLATQKLTDIAFWSLPNYEELVLQKTMENVQSTLTGKRFVSIPTRTETETAYMLLKAIVFWLAAQPLSMINQGIYAAQNIFTIVREEQLPVSSLINGFFINKPISTCITAKLKDVKTIFDKVNYLNRNNYILIDKHAISWTLMLSHLLRKGQAPKV